ncbi:MAG TPA: pyridoxamine 5'-phosphate oxidase family protein [Hanamia sp.]|nr:pyridoxamine 5'-phosphate oxidase family protein [Hanamia sp.]
MSNTKNLYDKEAIQKIKEMVDDIKTCMFCTEVENVPFRTRPMATAEVDEQGDIWFFSIKESNKNDEIKDDQTVQLLYAKNSDSHFLTITGKTEIVWDKEKIDKLWNPVMKAYFEGKDDPNISLLKVAPVEAHYWDTINGKMITLLKMATSAVTGIKTNVGVEGKIKV